MKLIFIYYQACDLYKDYSSKNVLRFSHNGLKGIITDEELPTIDLFCIIREDKHTKKSMYNYMINHWYPCFPNLPSYQTFNDRINRLTPVFPVFLYRIPQQVGLPSDTKVLVGGSFPIITCSAKRKARLSTHLIQ